MLYTTLKKEKRTGIFFRKPVITLLWDPYYSSITPQFKLLWLTNPIQFVRLKRFKFTENNGTIFPYWFSPICRTRQVEWALHVFDNADCPIKSIEVTAVIGEYETTGGYCDKEVSIVRFRNGKVKTLKTDLPNAWKRRSKNFFYEHLVRAIENNKALQQAIEMGIAPNLSDHYR